MPPSKRFSRLQDEQNLRLGDVSWVGVGVVEVVITESDKSASLFYLVSPLLEGLRRTRTELAVLLPLKSNQAFSLKS